MGIKELVLSYEILHRSGTMRWTINIFVHSQKRQPCSETVSAPSNATKPEVKIQVSELMTALNFTVAC
jgi:hypothetical protein